MVDWRWSYPSGVGPHLAITYLSVGGICEWRQGPKDSKKIATHPYRTHPKQFPVHQLWKESLHSLLVKVCWNNLRKKFVEHFSSVKVILFYNVVSPETGWFFVGFFSPPPTAIGSELKWCDVLFMFRIHDLAGGLKHFLCSPRSLGKWSNLTSIFFKWVCSTTN